MGVNEYVEDDVEVPDLLRVDPESEREQVERLQAFKADRDQALVDRRLEELRDVARGTGNLLPADPGRAARPRLDGRGVRRDAGRVREVRADVLARSGVAGAREPPHPLLRATLASSRATPSGGDDGGSRRSRPGR